MTHLDRRSALAALALASGLGIAGAAIASSEEASGLRCEIRETEAFGMKALEAVVHSDRTLAGTYSFKVGGPGANIRQGGAFSALPGEPATLGRVTVRGGSGYEARLVVQAGGETVSCEGMPRQI